MIKQILWNIFYIFTMNNLVPGNLSLFIDLKTSLTIWNIVVFSSCFIEFLSKKLQNRYLFITICFLIGAIAFATMKGINIMFYCIILIYINMIVRFRFNVEEEIKGMLFKAK